EPPLPIGMADYRNGCRGLIDLWIEGPSGKRGDPQYRIEVARNEFHAHRLRFPVEGHVALANRTVGKNIGEAVEFLAELAKQRIRKVASKLHESLGLMHRHHPQEYGIHQAEDRGIRADPQRQRNDRCRGEHWSLRQETNAVTAIA